MPAGLGLLGSLYGWAAARRRAAFGRRPGRSRRLDHPVISIGNLSVGGSGKTPVTLALAQALADLGERPAILSRGYARRGGQAEPVVVSDGTTVLAGVTASGDEPQLMARRLRGVPVVVARDRHQAGRLAESRFGVTVHLLDDGFQHLTLGRDVDLLLVSEADARDEVLPAGRLRERPSAAWAADAWLTFDADPDRLGEALAPFRPGGADAPPPCFALTASLGAPRALVPWGEPRAVPPGPAVAVAGIAHPDRFFAAVRAAGWSPARQLVYRDHHWFTAADWRAVVATARGDGLTTVVTTEKDAVRLAPLVEQTPAGLTVLYLPQEVAVPAPLRDWLVARLEAARC